MVYVMHEDVKISIIIPCYNASATLERCLTAVMHQEFDSYEVVVVDNGSSDGSIELVEGWKSHSMIPLKLIHEPVRGAAAARNRGVAEAKGEWLAFTDADCVPDVCWLHTGALLMESSNAAALAGPAWGTMEGDTSAKVMGLMTLSVGMSEHWGSDPGPEGMHGFAAANLWVRSSVFKALAGFNASLDVSGEDVDFCSRLYRSKEKILYSPSLKINHIHQSGIANMFWKMVSYGRAHATLLERYGQPGLHTDLSQKVLPLGSMYFSIQFRPADKKMMLLLLISLLWWPAIAAVPLYILYIARFFRQRAVDIGHYVGWLHACWMGCLLIVKSAGMTVGRVAGSRKCAWTL